MSAKPPERIGIMGGMFDPVHLGHLALAQQARRQCQLDRVLLLPCGSPVHRAAAQASAEQRIRMLELATANDTAWLQVDARECQRQAPSYTIDTIEALRQELPAAVLCLLVGLDAFLGFAHWQRWRELLDLVQLVVVSRPSYILDVATLPALLAAELAARQVSPAASGTAGAGSIVLAKLATPALSSTAIRTALCRGAEIHTFLPPAVAEYIHAQGLYR